MAGWRIRCADERCRWFGADGKCFLHRGGQRPVAGGVFQPAGFTSSDVKIQFTTLLRAKISFAYAGYTLHAPALAFRPTRRSSLRPRLSMYDVEGDSIIGRSYRCGAAPDGHVVARSPTQWVNQTIAIGSTDLPHHAPCLHSIWKNRQSVACLPRNFRWFKPLHRDKHGAADSLCGFKHLRPTPARQTSWWCGAVSYSECIGCNPFTVTQSLTLLCWIFRGLMANLIALAAAWTPAFSPFQEHL